jgi:hypothetical protein
MDNNKNKASGLSGIRKDNPFTLPDGYFESFRERLNNRMTEGNAEPRPVILLRPRYRLVTVAALIVILLVTGGIRLLQISYRSAPADQISEIMETALYTVSEQTILDAFEESHQETNMEKRFETEVIDHLMEEDISVDDILEVY